MTADERRKLEAALEVFCPRADSQNGYLPATVVNAQSTILQVFDRIHARLDAIEAASERRLDEEWGDR